MTQTIVQHAPAGAQVPLSRRTSRIVPVIPRQLSVRRPTRPSKKQQSITPQKVDPFDIADVRTAIAENNHQTVDSVQNCEQERQCSTSTTSDVSVSTSRQDTPISLGSAITRPSTTTPSQSREPNACDDDEKPDAAPNFARYGVDNEQSERETAQSSSASDAPRDMHRPNQYSISSMTGTSIESPALAQSAYGTEQTPPTRSVHHPEQFAWPNVQPFEPAQKHTRVTSSQSSGPQIMAASTTMSAPIAPDISPIANGTLNFVDSQSLYGGRNHSNHAAPLQYPPRHSAMQYNSMTQSRPDDEFPMFDWHMQYLFDSQAYADVTVNVLPANTQDSIISLRLHAAILSRSPKLRQLLDDAPSSAGSHKIISLDRSVYYKSPIACIDILRSLYGYGVPDRENFWRMCATNNATYGMRAASAHNMDHATSCIAVAQYMRAESMGSAWLEMARQIINVDNLEQVINFASFHGLDKSWVNAFTHDIAAILVKSSPFSKSSLPSGLPHGTILLHTAVDFIAYQLPADFSLDVQAPEFAAIDRFHGISPPSTPSLHAPRLSVSNPRLKHLRLGQFSNADGAGASTHENSTFSSLLLSLPTSVLKTLLKNLRLVHRLGPKQVSDLVKALVQERETRRLRAVQYLGEHQSVREALSEQQLYDIGIVETVSDTSNDNAERHPRLDAQTAETGSISRLMCHYESVETR